MSSLLLKLSREPKWTRPVAREPVSGDASDRPGISSALVGVTVKRTEDAMASRGCWGSARVIGLDGNR